MKKKIILGLIALVTVVGGVAAMSAYEAHVINVTAHIENALKVTPATGELEFGTVFPQEYHEKKIWITTSTSFCDTDQRRVLAIDYKIVQKPKCECIFDPVTQLEQFRIYCNEEQYAPVDYDTHACPVHPDGFQAYVEMPLLCPYLSKTPVQEDPSPYTDYGVPAFHGPLAIATGTIHKDNDLMDEWVIDLAVPCFEGYCAQDWGEFVAQHNPAADPDDYMLPAELESSDFGCDLWVEVTDIY